MLKKLKNLDNRKYNDYVKVFNSIRKEGPITKQQLLSKTGYKLTTLVRIIEWLQENQLICEDDTGESTGGRKPVLYILNSNAGYIISVDIARMYTKVALLDISYCVRQSTTFGMYEESTWEITLEKILELIEELCKGIEREKLLGIGVGIVGPIDKEQGILLNPVNFLASGWENAAIKKSLEDRTGLVTIVENGVNVAALAEYNSSCYKNYSSIVYINAGVGLRLGQITRSGLSSSSYSNEEGFGHMIVDIAGTQCYCGNNGCIEMYVSVPAILNSFISEIKKGRHSTVLDKVSFDISLINLDIFCEAVNNGDELAIEIIKKAATYFGIAIINTVNIINPEMIIIGGPLVKKCRMYYDLSVSIAKEKMNRGLSSKVTFSSGNLGENAVIIGAANLMLDDYLKL